LITLLWICGCVFILPQKGENIEQDDLREALKSLKLSNEAVTARENSRPPVEAPWWIRAPYILLCAMLDIIFKDRPIQRFWFLETVARMPYFSYPLKI
jgi:ubiquinol oxidase